MQRIRARIHLSPEAACGLASFYLINLLRSVLRGTSPVRPAVALTTPEFIMVDILQASKFSCWTTGDEMQPLWLRVTSLCWGFTIRNNYSCYIEIKSSQSFSKILPLFKILPQLPSMFVVSLFVLAEKIHPFNRYLLNMSSGFNTIQYCIQYSRSCVWANFRAGRPGFISCLYHFLGEWFGQFT